MVRTAACAALQLQGYTLLTARDGREALQLCTQHKGPIHLLLSDVVMPLISGPELARRVAPLRPALKVLYMSGYTADALGQHGLLARGTALLQKPFTPETLARKVREVLETTPPDRKRLEMTSSKRARSDYERFDRRTGSRMKGGGS